MKNILKNFKLNENNISMLLGAVVIVIVGFLVVNYFKNLDQNGSTLEQNSTTSQDTSVKLPTTHSVEAGETLWSIAEKYYKSGYNWVDIQKANNLTDASVITKGQVLTIPDVEAKTLTVISKTPIATTEASPVAMTDSSDHMMEATSTAIPTETTSPSMAPTTKGGLPINGDTTKTAEGKIDGNSYTVVHGDNLWTIAVRAYGNGYKWAEIAKANKLSHPGVIHAGNVLTLPR